MPLSSRDERRLTLALKELVAFWPHLLLPTPATSDQEVPGIVMYRDLEGALQLKQALDDATKGMLS